ncbi:hypothetical protein TWF569_010034 [Orbilia oligospora]|nr:hypothetical protein TWF103_009787 [Orbilia oligospora]KAF3134005.1 hypothetical protein TWF594_008868 [Orbilia oligospora]KAF3135062.1 hypothetical protein TWF569_010034 [Orbilia oligospora]
MVNLIDLPPEIQFNIYRELFHSQDFVNVCITCRLMNKIATPLLYEMVNISADNDYRWEDRQVRCLTEMDNRNMPLIKQLLNFCVRKENTKECMKLIERLEEDQLHCIELFHKHETSNPDVTFEIDESCTEVVKAMFLKNKKLRALYVDMGEKNLYEIFFPLISASANWLSTLILVIEKTDSFLYDVDTLISFLGSLKFLRSFELDMVEYFEDSPWQHDNGVRLIDSIFEIPTIEQVVFGGSDFPYERYNQTHKTKRIGSNLTQFGFFSGVGCDRFLRDNFDPQRLKALRILWPVDTDFDILSEFLMSFKGLRSLHLTLRNPDRFDTLHCIAHHGGSLERLSLRVFTPDFKPFGRFAHIDEFEYLLKHCTALRELAVPVTYIHQHWYRGPGETEAKDVLYEDLNWSFHWPNVVCPIESLHVLNEPVPANKDLRQSYSKDRRMEVITRFAMDLHNQVNILGASNHVDPYQVDETLLPAPTTTTTLENEESEPEPILTDEDSAPTSLPDNNMPFYTWQEPTCYTSKSGFQRRLKQIGPELLPNLRSILFGDNTKCGRDSCLYLHDWEFEEMDLVPVVIDKVDYETGYPDIKMEDDDDITTKKTQEKEKTGEKVGEEAKPQEDGTEKQNEGECPGGNTCLTRREGREATTWVESPSAINKHGENVGGGTLWKFKEVDWAEFVGRFPWLHDFEIDARGWMDERTRIENRDKFRFWE